MESGKVGFGFAKKPAKRKDPVAVQENEAQEERELIKGMAGNTVDTVESAAPPKAKLVIPNLANTFQVGTGKRKVELYLPDDPRQELASTEDRFELMPDASGGIAQENVTYGLNKMARPAEAADVRGPREGHKEVSQLETGRAADTRKFKEEMSVLPDHCRDDDYEAMPVEAFGEAMLRGMGWEEGKPLGKYQASKGTVAPVAYVPRPRGLGLGAQPAAPPEKVEGGKKRIPKSGEGPRFDGMVVAPDADGKVRHVRSLDDKAVEQVKPGAQKGKTMVLVAGQHAGLKVEVLSVVTPEGRSERATVRLKVSDERLTVRTKELADLNTPQAESALRAFKAPKRGADAERQDRGRKAETRARAATAAENAEPAWLMPNIRVKIVSKSLEGGTLYLKKAEVVDVLSPKRCSICLDSGHVVTDVAQRHLETTMPKSGGRVVVLLGRHKRQRGKLIERHSDTAEATIQLNEDFAMVSLPLDYVSEFLGVEDEED